MTKADILAAVIKRTGRTDLTEVDAELLAVLIDATARHAFLKSITTQSWTAGMLSVAFPAGATRILHITLPDSEPLTKIPFSQYLSYGVSAADTGEPTEFATDNSLIYPWTIPEKTYAATVYSQITHPSDLTTILLSDRFKECVISGVCFKVFSNLEMGDEANGQYQIYENQLAMAASKLLDEQTETVAGYY
jgi:hypothetical protein